MTLIQPVAVTAAGARAVTRDASRTLTSRTAGRRATMQRVPPRRGRLSSGGKVANKCSTNGVGCWVGASTSTVAGVSGTAQGLAEIGEHSLASFTQWFVSEDCCGDPFGLFGAGGADEAGEEDDVG